MIFRCTQFDNLQLVLQAKEEQMVSNSDTFQEKIKVFNNDFSKLKQQLKNHLHQLHDVKVDLMISEQSMRSQVVDLQQIIMQEMRCLQQQILENEGVKNERNTNMLQAALDEFSAESEQRLELLARERAEEQRRYEQKIESVSGDRDKIIRQEQCLLEEVRGLKDSTRVKEDTFKAVLTELEGRHGCRMRQREEECQQRVVSMERRLVDQALLQEQVDKSGQRCQDLLVSRFIVL